jgi:RNA-directed DNA polymerase
MDSTVAVQTNGFGFSFHALRNSSMARVRSVTLWKKPRGGFLPQLLWISTEAVTMLLDKIAKRIQDHRSCTSPGRSSKFGGEVAVPQRGPFSPLAANIYLNEVDWFFDAIRHNTAEGDYEAMKQINVTLGGWVNVCIL